MVLSSRNARNKGLRRSLVTMPLFPARMPACGPPSSLSPLNETRSAPARRLSPASGSSTPYCAQVRLGIRCRDLRRAEGRARAPMSTSSPSVGRAVKPEMRKLLGCTRSSRRVSFGNRGAVIGDGGAVRRADFAQDRAGSRHDFRNAKAIADFDQLAARDDRLAAGGELVQRQEQRRGIVIHGDRRGAQQLFEERGEMAVALAAPAGGEVVFQIRVAAKRIDESERRAAEVRMQHDAGSVHHTDLRGPFQR